MGLIERIIGAKPAEAGRVQGEITKLHHKGWGFIKSESLEFTRVFFHWTELDPDVNFKQLETGMKVEFTPAKFPGRGTRALDIKVIQ